MKKTVWMACLCSFLFFFSSFQGKELGPSYSLEGELRRKGLFHLDETLSWAIPFSSRTLSLEIGVRSKVFNQAVDDLEEFSTLHGYFSCFKPLVGVVTEDLKDVDAIQKVFTSILLFEDLTLIKMATEEILGKVLAYRNLQKGMKITLPIIYEGKAFLAEYEVDTVLDLWQGMPAFGLISVQEGANPILLFRGTDFSLLSKSSWASIISDLDLLGAGFSAFHSAEAKIHEWLVKASLKGKSTVIGFSLGGVLAIYTSIYQNSLIKECVAFNSPGVSKAVFEDWQAMDSKPSILHYATQGDLVSKVGKMISTAFELSDKKPMGPIEAHTKLMSSKSPLLLFRIDIEKENKARSKSL